MTGTDLLDRFDRSPITSPRARKRYHPDASAYVSNSIFPNIPWSCRGVAWRVDNNTTLNRFHSTATTAKVHTHTEIKKISPYFSIHNIPVLFRTGVLVNNIRLKKKKKMNNNEKTKSRTGRRRKLPPCK